MRSSSIPSSNATSARHPSRRAANSGLANTLELDPTLAVVWLVADDADRATPLGEYRRGLDALVRALRDAGARVLLTSGFEAGGNTRYADAVDSVAEATGAVVVDLDGIDASDLRDGAAAIAARFADAAR